jgi:hypothetical protein
MFGSDYLQQNMNMSIFVPLPTDNAAFFFGNRVSNTGYENPSFDVSSEQHHTRNTNYTDDFSSDDESQANTSADRK